MKLNGNSSLLVQKLYVSGTYFPCWLLSQYNNQNSWQEQVKAKNIRLGHKLKKFNQLQ